MTKELVGALNEIAGTEGLEAAGAADAAQSRIDRLELLATGGPHDHDDRYYTKEEIDALLSKLRTLPPKGGR